MAEDRVPLDAWTDSVSSLVHDISVAAGILLDGSIDPRTAQAAAAAANISGFSDTVLSVSFFLAVTGAGNRPRRWEASRLGSAVGYRTSSWPDTSDRKEGGHETIALEKQEFVELTTNPVHMVDVYGWPAWTLEDFALAAAPCIAYEILTSPTHGQGAVRKGADFVARRLKESGSHSAPADFWEVYSVLQRVT